MSTYAMCKVLIEKNRYEKEDMLRKLDVFLLGNRITEVEYKELTDMINKEEIGEVK